MSPGERTSRVIVATEGSMAAKEALERGGDPSMTERALDKLLLVGMSRNWPLMVARGCLAVLFGVSVLGWPGVTLATTVMRAWKKAGFAPVGHLVWHKAYASKIGLLAAHHEQAYLLAKGRPEKPPRILREAFFFALVLH